jgi:ribonuclease E
VQNGNGSTQSGLPLESGADESAVHAKATSFASSMPAAPMVGAAGAVAAAAAATTFFRQDSDAATAAQAPAPAVYASAPAAYVPAPAVTSVEAPVAAPAAARWAEPAAPAVVAPAPAPLAAALAPYVLPAVALQSVASAVGLEWVNSDSEKMRAVQAAMAAEPKPVHVPREPAPAVVLDEGPLVLVETKRDLSQLKLPFEMQGKA